MQKTRIYELAKELNTNSKRLMEKLAEINIIVKNHMSYLEDHELEALFNHIGVIKHEEVDKAEAEKPAAAAVAQPKPAQPPKPEPANGPVKDIRRDMRNAPRIIRKTKVIIDTKDDYYNSAPSNKSGGQYGGGLRRQDVVRIADANTGLRAGFTRDTSLDYRKEHRPFKSQESSRAQQPQKVSVVDKPLPPKSELQATQLPPKEEPADVKLQELQQHVKPAVNVAEIKKDTVSAEQPVSAPLKTPAPVLDNDSKARPDARLRPEVATNAGPVAKPDTRPVVGPDKGRDAKPGLRPDSRIVSRTDSRPDSRPGSRPDSRRDARPVKRTDKPEYRDRAGSRPDKKVAGPVRAPSKPQDRPRYDFPQAAKPGVPVERNEARKTFGDKAQTSEFARKEQRKEAVKSLVQPKAKKIKPQNLMAEKKQLTEVLSDDFVLDELFDSDVIKSKKPTKSKKDLKTRYEQKHIPAKAVLTSITIPETLTVKELSEALKKTSTEVIKKLMGLGIMANLNQEVDFDTATLIADEFGVKTQKQVVITEEDILFDDSEDDPEKLVSRPPVVVVMGHVDHGKTSLLDAIRETNVIDDEAGGITQHIGAYMVNINNRNITFLDTPGHEAFTAMRARGARVTDIAILVVAAEDGVMPQTVEAINHAKAANVSIIVALNKIDKPEADVEKVKRQLTEYGLVPEEWGGDVIFEPVSAKKRVNIDRLLEMVLLTADVMELKANPHRQAKGTIIEAKLDKNRGPIATVLVQRGTLNVGDSIVTGTTVGRIRAMISDKGASVRSAGPSVPVEIIGLPEVPEAGEIFYAIKDERVAKQLAEKRKAKQREEHLKTAPRVSLDALFDQIKEGKVKELNIIIKADVQGSVEAIAQSLEKLSNEEVRVRIIHGGVGAVTESDVRLAEVSNAIIIGFNVRPALNVAELAESVKVDLRFYRIIYNAIQDIQDAMKGMLEPSFKEVVTGHTEVRHIYKISGVGVIGGCQVLDGKITRNSDIRLVRNGIVIYEGKLASLKRFKDDAKEVLQGFECGLSIEKYNDISEGEIVESYEMEEVAQ